MADLRRKVNERRNYRGRSDNNPHCELKTDYNQCRHLGAL